MRILLITHGLPPAASAGTEVYTRELAQALAATGSDDVWVLARHADRCRPEYSVWRDADGPVQVVRVNNTFQACESFAESYANPALLDVAMREIVSIAPDVVHAQHLTCLSTGLPAAIRSRGIPFLLTLNDYWLICHRGQLFDELHQRCGGPFEGGCGGCVPAGALAPPLTLRAGRRARSSAIPGAGLAVQTGVKVLERLTPSSSTARASLERLQHMRAAVAPVDLFLAPSATIASWFLRFGVPPDRIRRCTQGIDVAPFASVARTPAAHLRVGFAGGTAPSKGAAVLLDAVARLPPRSVTVDLFGQASPATAGGRMTEQLLAQSFVRRAGPVPHERMPEALGSIDIVAVPSLWIENAPFIIREAFAAGAPVVASNLGGMAEMVRHELDGLLVEPGNPSALACALRRFLDDPGLLERLRSGITAPATIEADAVELRALYHSVAPRRSARARPQLPPPAPPPVAAVVLNYRTPEQTWLAVRSLQACAPPADPIVVVENGSGDGSAAWLRARLPGVPVLDARCNLGFPGGCNVGLRELLDDGVDMVMLVNSDVVVRPDALAALLRAAADHPDAGILGPVMMSRGEPDRIASAGIAFDRRTGRMRHRAANLPLSLLRPSTTHEVDAVSGGAMLIRADVLRKIGLLDEEFFFYFEDVEFCLRARGADFLSMCVPEAIVYHEGGLSIGRRSPRRVYFAARNHLRLASSVGGGGAVARGARTALVLGLNAAYVMSSREVPLLRGLFALGRGVVDHFRGRYGPGA